MIRTEGLTRHFGDLVAVDGLDLEVERGEVLAFLGPNGAGKTTTVRMLSALIAPTSGRAEIDGIALGTDDHAIRRKVGLLTESPGMYDRLSAARNLAVFAELYDVPDVDARVERYLRLLGLWDRRHDPAGSFSKGMKQKLAIARCLLHDPPLVFLDEPTAGLDPEATRLVRDFILELKGQGRTIFLCTHNLEEADRVCDRIALFRHRLRVLDTPARLRDTLFGRQVSVRLRALTDDLVEAARRVPGVSEATVEGDVLTLRVAEPDTTNPEVVRALVGAGADIIGLRQLDHSLEDVYLRLVADD